MPVHMAYAVPSGRVFVTFASKMKLTAIPAKVSAVQPIFVKPSDSFINVAHTTSNIPAMPSIIQAIISPPKIKKTRLLCIFYGLMMHGKRPVPPGGGDCRYNK